MDSYDAERIARLESQVAELYRHLGLTPGAEPMDAGTGGLMLTPAFYAALQEGKMIHAIKIYREVTGVGLKEAKEAVDAMARGRVR